MSESDKADTQRGAGPAARRARRLESGERDRRPRHARARLLHRLPDDLHGAQRAPGAGDRRRGEAAPQAGAGAAARRLGGGRGGRLDRARLPRLRPARLHRGGAAALRSSRISGARRRGSSFRRRRMASEGTSTVPRMGSFKRAFFGYRRSEVEAALASRDARNWALERDAEEALKRWREAAETAAQRRGGALPRSRRW